MPVIISVPNLHYNIEFEVLTTVVMNGMETICSPKRRLTFNGLHGVMPQKMKLFILP
jgi:hypothetical protein